jgi:hypothetical protein
MRRVGIWIVVVMLSLVVLSKDAAAEVDIDPSYISGRCIKITLKYQASSGPSHTVTATVYRGKRAVARRKLTATATWHTYRVACPKPGIIYRLQVKGPDGYSDFTARVPNEAAPPMMGALGSTLYVDLHALAVTATVLDPVVGSTALETPKSGNRFVAVRLALLPSGPEPITNNANVDTAVIGTDGHVYNWVFTEVPGCKNFNAGDYSLLAGQPESGCVSFELPMGVSVQTVQFGLGRNVEAQWAG